MTALPGDVKITRPDYRKRDCAIIKIMSKKTAEKTNADLSLETMTLEQLLAKAKADNHPWLPAIGIFQDDLVYEGWQQAIRDYRRSVDEDPQAL